MTHDEKVRSLAMVLSALDDGHDDPWHTPRYLALAEQGVTALDRGHGSLSVIELPAQHASEPELRALDRLLALGRGSRRRLRALDGGEAVMADEKQAQPYRILVGYCPAHDCDRVITCTNDGESWPLLECACGWRGGTTELARWSLYVRGGVKPVHGYGTPDRAAVHGQPFEGEE